MKIAWHSVVMLPVLLLPVVMSQAQTCSNGLTGYEASDVCCAISCGQCGGSGCSGLDGGGGSCCTANIKAAGTLCSVSKAAPCNIDTDTVDTGTDDETETDTETETETETETQLCSNGLPGYEASDVCCAVSCGQCGGSGCSGLDGGGDSCCTANIKAAGTLCSVQRAAPCNIDTDTVDTGTDDETETDTETETETETETQLCSNGLPGYETADVCCSLSCGQCGGSGCSGLDGGGDSCCTANIKAAGTLCSVSKAAPCNIDTDTVVPDTEDTQTCPNGLPGYDGGGIVCCSTSCGGCAGSGCGALPGGSSNCCAGPIQASGILCSDSGAAPCIIDGDVEAPTPVAPTPIATTPSPVAPVAPTSPTGQTSSPTPVMEIPTSCTAGNVPTFRYAASSGKVGKGRLYAESAGCFTMTDIYNWRGTESSGGILSSKGPIYQLDDSGDIVDPVGAIGEPVTNKWLLTAELYVTDGAIFYCKGASAGGDCDELRIQSTGPDDWYEVRGHGGSLYFEDTIVTSWDTPNNKPQEVYEGGRSFLNCVSEKLTGDECEGNAKDDMGECRMDLINSEFGYMGWFDSESYGLTWKVRGFCQDLSNPEVFDTTNVYGDIIGCDIHHMYYGHYTYGHQGGVWTDNKMHDNWQYGFDPHDDSDYLTIARNEVYNNVNHGIIASKRCNNVKIYDNVVRDGGADAVGIFLHRSSDFAEVYDNTIYNMPDAGIALLEAMNADIHDNSIDNVQYGIRMSLGSANNNVYDNTFNDCSDFGLYTYQGSDAPTEGISNGRPSDNTFDNNEITNTAGGVKFKYSDNIVVTNNVFTGTTELEFFDAQATVWSGNTIPSSGVCVDNISSDDGSSIRESTFLSSSGLPADC